eukprot:gene10706-12452_t
MGYHTDKDTRLAFLRVLSNMATFGSFTSLTDFKGPLLNVLLVNLCGTTHSIRLEAYNVLAILCDSRYFNLDSILLETNGLYIPRNVKPFVLRVSEMFAASEGENIAATLIMEALDGFNRAPSTITHRMSLDYIIPWLPLYSRITRTSSAEATVAKQQSNFIFTTMITLTIDSKSSIPSRVWEIVGQDPDLASLALATCLERCKGCPPESLAVEAIGEIIAIIAAQTPLFVSGLLIHGLLDTLALTGDQPTSRIDKNSHWPTVAIYLRLLFVLSFEDLACIDVHLPALLHIIATLFGIGSKLVRHTTYSLLINIGRSYIDSHPKLPVPAILDPSNRSIFRVVHRDEERRPKVKITSQLVDTITSGLYTIITTYTSDPKALHAYHDQWLNMALNQAKLLNPPVQTRALLVLSNLTQHNESVSNSQVLEIIRVLSNLSTEISNNSTLLDTNRPLILAALICLSRVADHMPSDSQLIQPLFWVATSFSHLSDAEIFAASTNLMHEVLKTMERRNILPTDISLSRTLLQARKPFEAALSRLDTTFRINFSNNFSFALSSLLIKGLYCKSSINRLETEKLLRTLIRITGNTSSRPSDTLGYITCLIPIDRANTPTGSNNPILDASSIPDVTDAIMLFTLLSSILNSSNVTSAEQTVIFEALAEGIKLSPQAFVVTYSSLVSKISTVIVESNVEKLVRCCLAVTEQMFTTEMMTIMSKTKPEYIHIIERTGFNGLQNCGQGFNVCLFKSFVDTN